MDKLGNFFSFLSSEKIDIITKDSILTNFNKTMLLLNNETAKCVSLLLKDNTKLLDEDHGLKIIKGTLISKPKSNIDVIKEFDKMIKDINNEEKNILKLINELDNTLALESMSLKAGAVIRLVTDINFMAIYILDIIMYSLTDDDEKTDLPKKRYEDFKSNLSLFVDIFNTYYGELDKSIKNLLEMTDENVNFKSSMINGVITSILSMIGKKPISLPMGFVGNPIYHFRLWQMGRDVADYEAQKAKKNAIEFKLTDLKLRESEEGSSENLTKQIRYWEEKIVSLEYKIKKFEEN